MPVKDKNDSMRRDISPINSYFKKKSSPSPINSKIDTSTSQTEVNKPSTKNFVPVPIPVEVEKPSVKIDSVDPKSSQLSLNQYVNINSTTKVIPSQIHVKQVIKTPVIPLKTTTYEKTTVTFPGPGVMVINPKGMEYHSFVQKNSDTNIGKPQKAPPLLKSMTTFTTYQSVNTYSEKMPESLQSNRRGIDQPWNSNLNQAKNNTTSIPRADSVAPKFGSRSGNTLGLTPVKDSSHSVQRVMTHSSQILQPMNTSIPFSSNPIPSIKNHQTYFDRRIPSNSSPMPVQPPRVSSKIDNPDFQKIIQYESNKSDLGDKSEFSTQK